MTIKKTTLKQHKKQGKTLLPPFMTLGNVSKESRRDERLPDILWAILLISEMDREKCLNIFREVSNFVENNNECYDITFSGILSWNNPEKQEEFIKFLIERDENIKDILSPLLLFKDLPLYDIRKKYIVKNEIKENLNILCEAVAKTLFHQSQESTDCRRLRLICAIKGGIIKYNENLVENLNNILNYPNSGDMRKVRPDIRANEIMLNSFHGEKTNWPSLFRKDCLKHTSCVEPETLDNNIILIKKSIIEKYNKDAKKIMEKYLNLKKDLIIYHENISREGISISDEISFGMVCYALSLVIEMTTLWSDAGIIGRICMRTLVELYITLMYLEKQGKESDNLWECFRDYGLGQLKLIYLKYNENNLNSVIVDKEKLENAVNSIIWDEFININIGKWGELNLRDMSIEIGLKDVYDKYYDYCSGYSHGSRGAVLESTFSLCMNPLHKGHNTLQSFYTVISPTIDEICEISDKLIEFINKKHPDFKTFNK